MLGERAVPVSHGRRSMGRASRHPSHGAAGTQPRLPARPQLPSLAPLLSLSSFFSASQSYLRNRWSGDSGLVKPEPRRPPRSRRRRREGGEGSVARPPFPVPPPPPAPPPSCSAHPAGVSGLPARILQAPGSLPAPRSLTCSKSRRVCVWASGPISRSLRRHVCTKGPAWRWAPGGTPDPLGSAGTGSSSPSPHSPSWEAGGEQGRAAVSRAKRLLHTSSASEESHGHGSGPGEPRPSLGHRNGPCREAGAPYPPWVRLRGPRRARCHRCRGPCGEQHTAVSHTAPGLQAWPRCATPKGAGSPTGDRAHVGTHV